MKLSKVLAEKRESGKLYTINSGASIKDAAKKFVSLRIGSLMVVEPNSNPVKYLGLISRSDAIRAVSFEDNIEKAIVDDYMTTRLIVANIEDDVDYVMNVMVRHNITHLPVISGKSIVGIVSRSDILQVTNIEKEIEIRWLSDYTLNDKNEVF